MDSQIAYCSACDQPVRIVVTDPPLHGGQAILADPQVVCLHFGDDCTGSYCPMFGLPRILMGVRLARSEFEPDGGWHTIEAYCDGCGRAVEQQVLDDRHAHCPSCDAVNRYLILRLEDGTYVAAGSAAPPAASHD
jgi:hypothetical protein